MHDAEYHYYKNFAIKEKKPGFIHRILEKFENFMMDFSMRDVNEYLSQSQNRYDLEQRERRVMRGDFKLVLSILGGCGRHPPSPNKEIVWQSISIH